MYLFTIIFHLVRLVIIFSGVFCFGLERPLVERPLVERSLVVVIPSYNNAEWYKRNLSSVFMQQYENYRIIYLDDASTDGTYELVKEYIKEQHQEHRVLLLHNDTNVGALAGHYQAVLRCTDQEIIINLDGDDWLKHSGVLRQINRVYSNDSVWLTYGSYENFPSGKVGAFSRPLPAYVYQKNAYREYTYVTSHLRTFYAKLFKQIKLGDLLYQGKFFTVACDTAFMFPMLEMAGDHAKYLKDVFYVYNQSNPYSHHNHHKKGTLRHLRMTHVTRARRKYKKLNALPVANDQTKVVPKVGIIVLSENNSQQLEKLLQSIDSLITNVGMMHVIYRANNVQSSIDYNILRSKFTEIDWQAVERSDQYKPIFLQVLGRGQEEYATIVRDTGVVNSSIDMAYCVQLMKQTHAYGFFLALGKNVVKSILLNRKQKQPPTVSLGNNVFAWKFKYGEFDWRAVHNVHMTLYRRDTILACLRSMAFNSIDSLVRAWEQCMVDSEDVGLFFKQACVTKKVSLE